jgi:NAD(P)-dependent dehydrogenase (short-subunit alcohol dehydrogenase family)
MTTHPVLQPGRVAVITGAAGGIGLAAARRFAKIGLKVVLADLPGEALDRAAVEVAEIAAGGPPDVRAVPTDVSSLEQVEALRDAALDVFGTVDVLMNNAGIGQGGGPWENYDRWRQVLDVNLFGIIHGVQAFTPTMIGQGRDGLIINTGSKQGITTPPGDTAYNVSKAGVKALTEGLAHALRETEGCGIAAHLLIPGYTFTGITARGATEKPAAAWSADEVIDFMLDALGRGDFYILCPDNDVTRPVDEKRIRWAAEDIIRNRPALSRWHPDHKADFAAYMAKGD